MKINTLIIMNIQQLFAFSTPTLYHLPYNKSFENF